MKKMLVSKLIVAAALSAFVFTGCGQDSGQRLTGDEAQFGEPATYSRSTSSAADASEDSAKTDANSSKPSGDETKSEASDSSAML